MTADPCPLCAKLADLAALPPGDVVWEFPHSVALLGPWQFYKGYCVLVSRSHATELNHLVVSERRGYLDEMCLLAWAIEKAVAPAKLNYELLGNQVPHLHWHLFPRSADDPNRLRPVWFALDEAERDPISRRQMQSEASRPDIAAALRAQLVLQSAPGSAPVDPR